ncbi:MAG: type II toxin-antitoxin system HigB family toxin [Marinilabiliaceae bacterium]|nr:type II toxin-antitoxin system HigB family toxin [Marinilabiliaceae bacterium]
MKVHLIKKQSISDYVLRNAPSQTSFDGWWSILRHADWQVPVDIVKTFNQADMLGNGTSRVVFNVGGNRYRLICQYYFGKMQVHLFVKWIGTHAEYTKL